MKVSKEIFLTAQTILKEFDPARSKSEKLAELEAARPKPEELKVREKLVDGETHQDLSLQAQSDRWEKVVKQIEVDEKIEEVKETNYTQK